LAKINWANLSSANLSSANLSSAKIGDHECDGRFVQLVNVAEWGNLLAFVNTKGDLRIVIGCRHMDYAEMAEHWADRSNRPRSRVALAMAKLWFDSLEQK
jgi:hypothetical protein